MLPVSDCPGCRGVPVGHPHSREMGHNAQHSAAAFWNSRVQLSSAEPLLEIPYENAMYFQMCVVVGCKILFCQYDLTGNKAQVQNGLSPAPKRSELLYRAHHMKNLLN